MVRRHLKRAALVVAVFLATTDSSAVRADWVTLSAGRAGVPDPTAEEEFLFETPHGPPLLAVDRLGGTRAEARTAGGVVYFGGLGAPVTFNLADGAAYLAGGDPPAGATGRGPGGRPAGPLASEGPRTDLAVSMAAALLGVELTDAPAGGSTLSISVRDADGTTLGESAIGVPDGGWWVIGLGADTFTGAGPDPDPPGPPPIDPPAPPTGPVAGVPEPGTAALAVAGLGLLRLRRGRRNRTE